ncbi:MAG: POTRA domain-containing protein [Acidobacteriota bacterium]
MDTCLADSPPDSDTLQKEGAIIGKIIIERVDVFDPRVEGEENRLFKFINLLHLETHESVIRRELLFKEGDPYVKSRVEESARNLRNLHFLHTARIEPIAYHDGVADLKVYTQDAWTAKAGVNIGRKGGMNTFKMGLEDENFLGLGKKLSVEQFKGIENSGTLFRYYDNQLLGTKWKLISKYETNTDGQFIITNISYPFFSLDSRKFFQTEVSRGIPSYRSPPATSTRDLRIRPSF